MPIPAELMSEPCVLATCVVGFGPGEGERLVTAAEDAPLSVERAGVFNPSKLAQTATAIPALAAATL